MTCARGTGRMGALVMHAFALVSAVVALARIPGPGSYPLGMSLNTGTGGTITFADGSTCRAVPDSYPPRRNRSAARSA